MLRPARLDIATLAAGLFVLAHISAILIGGPDAKPISYLFLIAAPLGASVACIRHLRRTGSAQGWSELALATLLWAAGMASNAAVDLLLLKGNNVPGLSMLCYVLYGVPLIFAVASPAHESWPVRAVDGILALVLSAFFWAHTFSVATLYAAGEEGVIAIRWLFDIENSFIALFALVRWQATQDPQRRQFFGRLSAFTCLYCVVAAYINHLGSDVDFGTLMDVVIPLPFLWLARASVGTETAHTTASRPSPSFYVAVRAASPLMLPAALLVVSCTLLMRAPTLAAVGFVTATMGYGLRTVILQVRSLIEREALDRLSRLDGLTGLPNRRQFDEALAREWARAGRAGTPVALLIIDIDHFKALNDGLGHLTGDARLREVAQEISACAERGSDFVGRYGGEEFVAILPGISEAMATAMAEKIRKAVAARALPTPAPGAIVTISIGCAWQDDVTTATPVEVIAAADAALYRAKANGRNRVERATETP